jgi:uncharacterized protein (DUF1684 family)
MTAVDHIEQDYATQVHDWQHKMESTIRAEDGWLTVVGLEWLQDGDNTIGSSADNDVTLPNERVPAQLGIIHLKDGQATLRVTTDDLVLVDGVAAKTAVLNSDASQEPLTLVQSHSVTFFVIKRGDQYAVRIRDTESEARRTFSGRSWFPVDEAYRVVGRFIPHESKQMFEVETVIGVPELMENPGRVEFELHGQSLSLEAFDGGTNILWFVLRDATSGISTYGASRFLKAPFAADGAVDLDFNRAYHPPCFFTPYATCPLPPRENRLTIAIEAGEKLPDA